ncbi:unnamed protein product [Ambrosiozyma monospora]|uniref:Unnamed protein product n=1 Tax=Ambrosiozyma monospora TaxID=43982 RepID=A0A9W6YVH1_AMBMO|nr:unnamed protein product [Ambrosiozyma monospora]
MPPDLSRYRPSPTQFQQILNGSILPIQATDPNCLFTLNQEEFQFDHLDGLFKPDVGIRISRSPLMPGDPSTYASLSKFVEQNLRKYHTTLGNVNQNQLTKPLSLPPDAVGVQPDGKTEVLPVGCGINPLISDHFKDVHLTPGSIVKIVDFQKELNNPRRSDALKTPKSNLNRTSSSFIVKVITCENFTKKLHNGKKFMVGCHGRLINFIGLEDNPKDMDVDVPLLRITLTCSVITAFDTYSYQNSSGGNELDILVGFASGDMLWVNPFKMKYSRWNKNSKVKNKPIMSIKWSKCGKFAIIGFSDGEIMVFNRDLEDDEEYTVPKTYKKDKFLKTFKSLNSSNHTLNPIAHYRMSRNAITDMQIHPVFQNIMVLSCDDGFIRVFDLLKERVTDLFPSYYSGFLCVNITNDGKYLLAGSGDDFVSIYEFQFNDQIAVNGLLKLVARLEGSKSWVKAIQVDYTKTHSGLLYRIGVAGDDNCIRFYEFQPRNLPKIKNLKTGKAVKRPTLDKRFSSATVDSASRLGNSPASISSVPEPHSGSTKKRLFSAKHLKNSESINSITSPQHPLSLLEVMNQGSTSTSSLTQLHQQAMSMTPTINTNTNSNSLLISKTDNIKNPLFKRFPPGTLINLDNAISQDAIIHPTVGLKYCPLLLPIGEKDVRLGRLSGLAFENKYVWAFVCTGDCIRWLRP